MYTFRIPIGDWSNDGHGRCEWFTVQSNKPVEDVQEAHFKGCAEIFDIHSILNEYEEYSVSKEILGTLPDWAQEKFDEDGFLPDGPRDLADLWIELMNHADPELGLTLVPEIPTIGNYSKGRRIGFVGYGLFE